MKSLQNKYAIFWNYLTSKNNSFYFQHSDIIEGIVEGKDRGKANNINTYNENEQCPIWHINVTN